MVFSASPSSSFSQSLRLFIATVCVVVLFILRFLGTALVLMLFIVGKVGVILSSTVCVLRSVAMVFMCLLFILKTTCCNGIHNCWDGVCSALDLLFNIRYVLPRVCKKLLKTDSLSKSVCNSNRSL